MLISIFALILSASPAPARLEDYQIVSDGEDYAPAMKRLQIDLARRPSVSLKAGGPIVQLDCGKMYTVASPLEWCLPMTIRGCGPSSSGFTPNGPFSPIHMHAEGKCPFSIPFMDKAKGQMILEELSVVDWRFSNMTYREGISATQPIVIRNVETHGFVVGVSLTGDATVVAPLEPSLVSTSVLDNVKAFDAQGPGTYIAGADANVIRTEGGSMTGNCSAGAHWASRFRPTKYCTSKPNEIVCTDPSMQCAGFFDVSFLGGTYISPHAAGNKDILTLQKYSGYIIVGESNRSVLIGPYSESFNCVGSCETPGGGNYMAAQVQVIGGHSSWTGPGTWIHGNTTTSLLVENEKDPANRTVFAIGAPNSAGAFYELSADADSSSKKLRMQYFLSGGLGGFYAMSWANSAAQVPYAIGGEKAKIRSKLVGAGTLLIPGAVYYGAPATAVREGRGPLPLPTLDDTWPDGSLWRRTGTSSVGAILSYEAQTISAKRKWIGVSRRN